MRSVPLTALIVAEKPIMRVQARYRAPERATGADRALVGTGVAPVATRSLVASGARSPGRRALHRIDDR
ncbi:hypothetical protein AFB00_10700 [Pseudonocardia sp. HH130630-07]|nr:hypothetical protein AFB00_10700 [Pseudonocardia sp. HH130630-07]